MNARIIDGKAIAADIAKENALRAARLRDAGTVPGLAVVIVGDDPASKVYVRNKALACEKAGVNYWVHAMPADTPQERLLGFLREHFKGAPLLASNATALFWSLTLLEVLAGVIPWEFKSPSRRHFHNPLIEWKSSKGIAKI